MKKIILNIQISVIIILLLLSCSEKILDKVPLDKYSDGTVWAFG